VSRGYLVDSDVFIDFLRGRQEALEFIAEHFPKIHLSTVTVCELYAGVREGRERERLEETLSGCCLIEVSPEVAKIGGLFRRDYLKSHAVTFSDALIAATAKEYGLPLATLNRKHFPMLTDLVVPYRKA